MAVDMQRARGLFLQALECSPERQESFLTDLQQQDRALHDQVKRLLSAHQKSGLLDEKAVPSIADSLEKLWDRSQSELQSAPPHSGSPVFSLKAGAVLGDFEILEEIASGGAGVVYRARQTSLRRIVALKFLRVGEFATEREVERFRAEAEAAARLDHPHIVPVYEVGELEGRHYFSMKVVEGPSLSSQIERLKHDHRSAVSLLVKVARAVHHAHQRGLLHRDLKPSNILLDDDSEPYVADFGIAKRIDPGESITQTGWVVGTPAYMAPEQVSLEAREVTVRTDVYALGCILYELLSGQTPFQGETISTIFRQVLTQEPTRLSVKNPQVHRDLETICLKCLRKEPELRYDSAADLAEDLQRWLEHKPVLARQASRSERIWLMWRRKPVVTSLAAAVVLLVIVLAFGATVASLLLRENLERAVGAEQQANLRLRNSLLAQAAANRLSGLPGQRVTSLQLLAQAALIQPGADLRDEAISSLSLTDLKVAAKWPRGRQGEITIAFSPGLRLNAVGFRQGRVEVRERFGKGGLDLPGFGSGVAALLFSPDERYLAVWYFDDRIPFRLWDLASAQPFDWPTAEAHSSLKAVFSPDSRWIAIGHSDGRLECRELPGGKLLWTHHLPSAIDTLQIRPDGKAYALGLDESETVEIRSLSGEVLRRLVHPALTYYLDWSPDGRFLAVGCQDQNGYIWDVEAGQLKTRLEGHSAEVVRIDLSPADSIVATYSWDETSRLWDADSGQQLLVTNSRQAGFSPDGRQLAYYDGEHAGIWDVQRGETFRTLYGHRGKDPRCMAISPDGRWLASGGVDGVLLWDFQAARLAARVSDRYAGTLFFDPHNDDLLHCGPVGTFRHKISLPDDGTLSIQTLQLSSDPCTRGSFSRQGDQLACVLEGESVSLISLKEPFQVRQLGSFTGVSNVDLSPDGQRVAAGNWRGDRVQIWRVEDGSTEAVLMHGQGSISVKFSPDGKRLATGSSKDYRLWEVGSWEEVRKVQRPVEFSNLPGQLAFSRDGRFLAVSMTQRQIQILQSETFETVATMEAPQQVPVGEVAFTPDRSWLVVSSRTNRIQMWNLDALRREIQRLGLDEGLDRLWPVPREAE